MPHLIKVIQPHSHRLHRHTHLRIFWRATFLSSLLLATASAQTSTDAHPCYQTPSPTLAKPSVSGQKDWYPQGLINEPILSKEWNKKFRQAQTQVLEKATTLALPKTAKHRGLKDRHGRSPRWPIQPAGEEKVHSHPQQSLQEYLIHSGLARADIEPLTLDCAKHLISLETEAREAHIGGWKSGSFKTHSAQDDHLSAMVSTYQHVRGTVQSVSRRTKGKSYVNFGKRWKTDFTVTFSPTMLKKWERLGISLDDLPNRHVYVRGWIVNRDGALIRITHPLQLIVTAGDAKQ